MKRNLVTLVACLAVGSMGSARAAELSLVSGLYKSETVKVEGEDGGGAGRFEIGARYGQELDERYVWYGEGRFSNVSYDAPKGQKGPSDSTGIVAGGGMRVMFKRAEIEPFLFGGGKFQSVEETTYAGAGWTQIEKSGLYYNAGVGMRWNMDRGFFFDFEVTAFETALFATETMSAYTSSGNSIVETKTSKKGLYMESWGGVEDTSIGFGMKF